MNRAVVATIVLLHLVLGSVWVAAQMDLVTFSSGDLIRAEDVNANFDTLRDAIAHSWEFVPTTGYGLPETFVAQETQPNLNEDFNLPRPARLLLKKTASVELYCENQFAFRWYFLTLDGVPLTDSLQMRTEVSGYPFAGELTAITEEPVAAGNHTLGIGAMCHAGDSLGLGFAIASSSTVMMIQ